MRINITPKHTIDLVDIVGLIVDKKDIRYGQIFKPSRLWEDDMQRWVFMHHICPDGIHYTSKNIHPCSHNSFAMSLLDIDRPPVDPPKLFYRLNGDVNPHINEVMRQHGISIYDLASKYKSIHGENKSLIRDYEILFKEKFSIDLE